MAESMTKKHESKVNESKPGETYDNPELDGDGIPKPQPGTENVNI